MAEKKTFLIIDGNALVHRAYHALPPMNTKDGQMVNAVYGFCLIFFKALKEIKPDFLAACFDVKEPTFRHKEFKEYKAKRKKAPDELYQQIDGVKKVLTAFGVAIFEKAGFEADDLIATLTQKAKEQKEIKLETIILSGDLDILQLVDEQTKAYTMKKGIKDIVLLGIKETKEKYDGLLPTQLTDLRALRGDASDNIPGVKGIGQKTAIDLLKQFGNLTAIYQAIEKADKKEQFKPSLLKKLEDSKKEAMNSHKMAKLVSDVKMDFKWPDLSFQKYQPEPAKKVLESFQFYSLLNKLPGVDNKANLSGQASLFETSQAQELVNKREVVLAEIARLKDQGALSDKIADLEEKLWPIVEQMEKHGIGASEQCLKKLSRDLEVSLDVLEKKIYQKAGGQFNINSPQQLSEALFERLKIATLGLKKTPGGVISTGALELAKIAKAHPIVGFILEYREVFKLKSGFVDALPKMISQDDGRIHPKFNQLGAETGRMTCQEPNLQNIPIKSDLGKTVRKCFLPADGFVFVSADYSQIDLRVVAALSGDQKMLQFFKQGKDIHQMTAMAIFNIKENEVKPEQRQLAKTLNFGILYGMGPHKLAQNTGLSFSQAQDFIENYFANFQGLANYMEEVIEKTEKDGFCQTMFGRKRFLPEINSRDHRLKAQAERIARNLPVQGTVADIMKMVMVKLSQEKILSNDCRMLLQIHDELLFEIKKEKARAISQKIKQIMENIVELKVPLKVDLKQGKNWGKLAPIF